MKRLGLLVILPFLWTASAFADEAPISGTVKAIDVQARTLTIEVASKGKTREVTIYVKPGARIVRFARSTDPGKTGFVEQEAALADVKPGWVVSATTKHEGNREVADVVKIVVER